MVDFCAQVLKLGTLGQAFYFFILMFFLSLPAGKFYVFFQLFFNLAVSIVSLQISNLLFNLPLSLLQRIRSSANSIAHGLSLLMSSAITPIIIITFFLEAHFM